MARKVACLTALYSEMQRDLGLVGLSVDVGAFSVQFNKKSEEVARSLRRYSRYEKVEPTHDMDFLSESLFVRLVDWYEGVKNSTV